jgi:CHASE3 domain sensor protein
MNIGFFIVGGIIFSVYIGLTLWNIVDSSKKSKQDNYQGKK